MAEPLIVLEDVHFAYRPDRPVLAGADFTLDGGERVGLVGPIGCGKTTLLHLIVGLLKPQSGTVMAFGKPVHDKAHLYEVRRRAGLVFQDADDQLFCPTVLEDVAFGPLNLGRGAEEAHALARETLARVGLPSFEERITYTLSGGEKRLVALATVLAMEPDVLLLDEPTNGLDEEARLRIGAILEGLPQALLLVSHAHDFVRAQCSRVVRLDGGRLESVAQ